MKVTTGYRPHAYHQQKGETNNTGFADMLAGMAADKHGRPEHGKSAPEKSNCCCHSNRGKIGTLSPLIKSFYACGCARITLTPEQAAELDALKKAASSGGVYLREYDNRTAPSGSECLQKIRRSGKAGILLYAALKAHTQISRKHL